MTHKNSALYVAENLHFSYEIGSNKIEALKGISITIPQSSVICLAGPSGSGKSTLLSVLGLIEPIQQGTIRFNDQDLGSLNETQKNHLRRYQIGFIFQRFHLLPVLSAQENVEYFLARQGIPRKERTQYALEALESVGLYDYRMKKPLEMSGGQQQRVAIARALAKKPTVIIADELTASLDQNTGKEIMSLLRTLSEQKGASVILASHDPMVFGFADRCYHIKNGEIV